MRSSSNATTAESSRSDEAKYRGVRKRKWGKWVSEIRLPNSRERIWLGSYDSPEKAARAFDAALFCLRGNTANFNFPDHPPDIPGGTELHPSEIQAVAARFANSYQLPDLHPAESSYRDSSFMEMDHDHVPPAAYNYSYDDHVMEVNNNSNISIPDFGIFPGFDDYFNNFMPIEGAAGGDHHYGSSEEVVNYDQGVYSQDPCYLWSF